ncbi:MAG: ATP-binding cassette domain-containing protein [Spirochaetia bacterium]
MSNANELNAGSPQAVSLHEVSLSSGGGSGGGGGGSGGGGGAEIFSKISVSIPLRHTTLVMGPSGSGKSTLLKLAAGLIPADEGTVRMLDYDLGFLRRTEERELRRRNGFVFQDAALWQNLSVYQNLALPLQYHQVTTGPSETETRVNALAERFDLRHRLSQRPAELSAGERKLVSFCRAIILEPELLFLDEPLSFVDYHGSQMILARLRELKKRGTTLIASTHSPKISSQLADYLIVLDRGGVIAAGRFDEIVHSQERRVVEILSEVLSEAASYDTDILDLLDPED